MDSGWNTSHVYTFCRDYQHRQVIPVKGKESLLMPISQPTRIDRNQIGKFVGFVWLWHVGSSFLKQEIYGYLRNRVSIETGEVPPGHCFFPQYDNEHFKRLTAEKYTLVTDDNGFSKYKWVKIHERNEQLDCRVYARGAAAALGYDRMDNEEIRKMRTHTVDGASEKPKKKKGTWY